MDSILSKIKLVIKRCYMILSKPHILIGSRYVGKNCFIGKRLQANKPKYITFGNNVRIGSDARLSMYDNFNSSKLKPNLVFGDNVYIGNRFTALCAEDIIIKDDVLIASDVMISSENHGIDPENILSYGKQSLICKPVNICEGCWIGEKVSILPGVTIGKKSIIGTNSVVTNDIPPYSMAVGIPAKIIKQYNFETHSWERLS